MEERSVIKRFLKNAVLINRLPVAKKARPWILYEYPFDAQLLSLSPLYLKSRQLYLQLGGEFHPRVCSTMRSLSAQDLFKDCIEYSPSASELLWFSKNSHDVTDPEKEIEALFRFGEISIFHEQNHRILWRLLPPAPGEQSDLRRYLNFAESIVVLLDLILGDQIGPTVSDAFESMRIIYRSGVSHSYKKNVHAYWLALFTATFFLLEMINPEDILPALNYIFPHQKTINRAAVKRSLQLSELFTRVTNPLWQERYWEKARTKLKKINSESSESPLYLPEDPLDFGDDLAIVHRVLEHFCL